jgi:hypothetical protein
MHVGDLHLQLPDSWWQEHARLVLRRAAAKLAPDEAGVQLGLTGAASKEHDGEEQQQQQPQLQGPRASRVRAAVDALCSILWACSQLPGQPLQQQQQQQQWLESCIKLLLPAVVAQQCSPGAAVLLLHACCAGACRKLPTASSTVQACLVCVQQRLQKVCADVNTLQQLLECMQLRSLQQQLPPGFCGDLEAVLVSVLPGLPAELLVEVAKVFGNLQHSPGLGYMSAFSLVTQQKLIRMGPQQISLLVDSCVHMRVVMPNVWVAAVLQRLQQCADARQSVAASHKKTATATSATLDGLSSGAVLKALRQLELVAADWPGACAGSAGAADKLQTYLQATV